jgi:hypothetical protein
VVEVEAELPEEVVLADFAQEPALVLPQELTTRLLLEAVVAPQQRKAQKALLVATRYSALLLQPAAEAVADQLDLPEQTQPD